MKVEAINEITSGEKNGKKWHLVAAMFGGKAYKGFVQHMPNVGDDLDVEFYQEEYKGEMQNKFKFKRKGGGVSEAVFKTELEIINRKLDLIMGKLEVKNSEDEEIMPSPFDGDMAGTSAGEEEPPF